MTSFKNQGLQKRIKINSTSMTIRFDSEQKIEFDKFVFDKEETKQKALAIFLLCGGQNPVLGELDLYTKENHEKARKLAEKFDALIYEAKELIK